MSEEIVNDVSAEENKPEPEKIDYRAELMNVLESWSQLGLQMQVSANNIKAQILQKEKQAQSS